MSALLWDIVFGGGADCRVGVDAEGHEARKAEAVLKQWCSLCDEGVCGIDAGEEPGATCRGVYLMSEDGAPVDGRTALELEQAAEFGSVGFVCPCGVLFGDAIGATVANAPSVHDQL